MWTWGGYLNDIRPEDATAFALTLGGRISERIGLPVDVRIINFAPVSFRFHVLRGTVLVNRDDERLTEMMEDTARRYLDSQPLLLSATKEAYAT